MPNNQTKRLKDSFSLMIPSIEAVRQNVLIYALLIVLPSLLISTGTSSDTEVIYTNPYLFGGGGILSLLLYPAVIYTYLHAGKGEVVNLKSAFSSYDKFWRLIGLGLLVGIIIILGFIAFIIPGIIFIRRYFLSPYYVMDRNMGIVEAMNTSAAESKIYSGYVYGVLGVTILIGLIGIFSLFGMIVSAILSILYSTAPAIRYLEIKKAIGKS